MLLTMSSSLMSTGVLFAVISVETYARRGNRSCKILAEGDDDRRSPIIPSYRKAM
jgi:hypothetical protein